MLEIYMVTKFCLAPTPADIEFQNFLLQLKNYRSGEKTVWGFYYLCFVFEIFHFKQNSTPFFLEYNSWQTKNL